jgi:translation initiation factor IF-3
VRLIDDQDEQIGIVDLNDAKRRAREAGQDLVEVAPMAKPPVCRIMDYGKWKYQQSKRDQKNQSQAKQSQQKEVRLRPKIGDNDLQIKLRRAKEFLQEGHKVQFTMLFRGREMAHRDIALQIMNEVKDELGGIGKEEQAPKMLGRRMTMVLVPERKQAPPTAKPAAGGTEPEPQPEAPTEEAETTTPAAAQSH